MNATPAFRPRQGALIGVIVLAWAILGCLAAWRGWQDRAAWIERDTAETANLARSLAQHAHDAIQAADVAIVDLRALIEIDAATPPAREQLLGLMDTQLAALPLVSALVAFDAAGDWTVNSRRSKPYNVADRDYFRFHRTHLDRGPRIGEPLLSRATGGWIVPVTRRVDAPDGRFAGVVLAMLPAETFLRFHATFDVGRDGEIVLLGTGGTILAHSRLGEAGSGRSLGEPLLHALVASPSTQGLDYVSPFDGVRRLGGTRRMDDLSLVLVASHGYGEALSQWRAGLRASLATGLAASLAMLLLAGRLARQARRRAQVEDALRHSEDHYRLIAENSTEAVVRLDAELRPTYVSPAGEALTGHAPPALLGRPLSDLVHPQDWPALSASLAADRAPGGVPASFRLASGGEAETWLEAAGRHVGEDGGRVVVLRDVTRRRKGEKQLHDAKNQLQRLVMQDGLTGVANRRCFSSTLQKELRRQARADLPLAVLVIDVDRFRAFNQAFGPAAGDACLCAVATLLAGQMQRPGDLVARLEGKTFAAVLPETDRLGAMVVAERARRAVCLPAAAHGTVTVSIGVAVAWPRRADMLPAELVALAEEALRQAKQGGRNRSVAATMGGEKDTALALRA